MASPYLKAALITIAIAALGFFFISQLDAMRAEELQRNANELLMEAQTERLLYTYSQVFGNSTSELCDYSYGRASAREGRVYDLAEKIRYYEKSNVVNPEYDRIRDQYYLANAELYLNARAAVKYCGASPYSTVLFFYKAKGDCPECRAQGELLDRVVADNRGVRVFAFPIDTDREFINVFVNRHGISEAPSIVIDDRVVLRGLHEQEEIEKYLESPG